jgi:hypothetical protein
MPGEAELRAWMHGEGSERPADDGRNARLDAATIIRRSRRRRLPRQIGAGGVLTLAVAGISVASVTGLKTLGPNVFGAPGAAQSSVDSGGVAPADEGAEQPQDAARDIISADGINRCGDTVAAVPANRFGLVLTPRFPAEAPATGAPVAGSVTLSNTGTHSIAGTTTVSPSVTISEDGVVVWHTSYQPAGTALNLAPGQSVELPATFTPVRCTAQDDRPDGFRAGLPALAPGQYRISVLLGIYGVALDNSSSQPSGGDGSELVTGDSVPITLE